MHAAFRFSPADATAKPGHRFFHPIDPGIELRPDRIQLDRNLQSGWCAASAGHAPRNDVAPRAAGQFASNVGAAGVGGGAGLIGLVFVTDPRPPPLVFVNPDRNVSLVLIPIGLVTITIGIALLVVTSSGLTFSPHRMRRDITGLFIALAGLGLLTGQNAARASVRIA